MKDFSPTLEEYTNQFTELMDAILGDSTTFEERISAMSMDEYKHIRETVNGYQRDCYAFQAKLAEFLRDGYCPWAEESASVSDPLRTQANSKIFGDYRRASIEPYLERFTNVPAVQAKEEEYRANERAIAFEKSLTITVDGVSYKAEKVIDVLWAGWECDSEAWLIKDGDTYKVATTDHGSHYFADKDFLMEKIAEYEKALRETKEFLVWIS
jgi:hypothetical protein